MIEIIAAIARWLQLGANLTLLGSCVFLALASDRKQAYTEVWIDRLERLFPWLAICIPVGLFIILTTNLIQVIGNTSSLWQLERWLGFIKDTRAGQIWVWRAALSLLLLFTILYLRVAFKARWRYYFCAVIATLPLIASSFVSHTAAEEFSIQAIMPYALHLILAGVWFGALPAFLMLVYDDHRNDNKRRGNLGFETLKQFSSIALPVMLSIILTGIIVGNRIFDDHYAALIATPYGWLLSAKILLLGVILLIAARIRSYWLPLLINNHPKISDAELGRKGIKKWVRIEFTLALILVLLATLITNTTPVKHALIEQWPFSFRFSITATWNQPNVIMKVWIGIVILVIAAGALKLGQSLNWGLMRLISIPGILFILGLGISLPPLTIQAYPETYRRPLVPFDANSIANGSMLYTQHCIECHGPQGKGNGIKSRTLSTKLPDLLTEPHTTEHTPGDFYNWITYGMANTDMPGYLDKLSDEDRWDLVNYIHALSRGYQARILTPEIIPNKAHAKPPVFSYVGHDRSSGVLQDFRENKTVLLVIFSWPESKERMEQLKSIYAKLNDQKMAVLAVPSKELTMDELAQVTSELPFPVITQNTDEIVSSYSLSRRTLSHPDIIGRGTNYTHMEFLIDRYGYLRARWIPSIDQSGWSDTDLLNRQISLLNRENTKKSFPDDYVR